MDDYDQASLDCPVCKEQYDTGRRTPKMMPCLHTVCASCLHDLTAAEPPSPSTILNKQIPIPPPPVSTSQEEQVDYEEVNEQPEVSTPPSPPPPPPHQPHIPHTIHRIAGPNAAAISNLASILQGTPRTPLRRLTVPLIQPVEELPPPLPVRNPRMGPPPLRRKPMTVKPPPISLTEKEPEIPRNVAFQCPVCRAHNDFSKLQTNRYVVAHIRDLQRLVKQSEPVSPSVRSSQPVEPPGYDGTSFTHEKYWCTTCIKPCSSECATHTYQPLEEYAQSVRASLQGMLNDFEGRLLEHSNSLEHTDASFKYVFHILNKASRHLWKMNQNTQDLKEKLTATKNSLNFSSDSSRALQEALILTSKVESIRALNEQLTRLENGINSDEIFIWRQNNKLYVSTKEPDQTIIIAVNESSRRNQAFLDQLPEATNL